MPYDRGWCYAYWALGHHAAHFEWSDKTLCLGHGSKKGGKGKKTDPCGPDLPCVMLTDHWVATHIIASVSDQPNGRRYPAFSCKSTCISCTLAGPCAHWTWAPILETSSWLSTRSPHTSLVFWVITQPADKTHGQTLWGMRFRISICSPIWTFIVAFTNAQVFFRLNMTEKYSNLPEPAWLPLLNNNVFRVM